MFLFTNDIITGKKKTKKYGRKTLRTYKCIYCARF